MAKSDLSKAFGSKDGLGPARDETRLSGTIMGIELLHDGNDVHQEPAYAYTLMDADGARHKICETGRYPSMELGERVLVRINPANVHETAGAAIIAHKTLGSLQDDISSARRADGERQVRDFNALITTGLDTALRGGLSQTVAWAKDYAGYVIAYAERVGDVPLDMPTHRALSAKLTAAGYMPAEDRRMEGTREEVGRSIIGRVVCALDNTMTPDQDIVQDAGEYLKLSDRKPASRLRPRTR